MITRYLLGDLSEAEAAQLEDSSFRNPEQLEALRSVENDLIDEYARGELSSAEKAKFEALFFATAERRQRVEFALALARVSRGQSRVRSRERTQSWSFFTPLFQRPALGYASVALAAAVLIGFWWLLTRPDPRNDQVVTRQSGPEKVIPGSGSSGPSPETATQSQPPEIVREQSTPPREDRPQQNNRNRDRGISPGEATVATFMLLPGLSRSNGERTKLVIPHGRQSLRLKLKLEQHDAVRYQNFAAELSRANAATIWASQTVPRNGTVVLNIPLSKLAAESADYDLTLRGTGRGGNVETLGYYYLTIVRE